MVESLPYLFNLNSPSSRNSIHIGHSQRKKRYLPLNTVISKYILTEKSVKSVQIRDLDTTDTRQLHALTTCYLI